MTDHTLRFAILRHNHPSLHWDLFLEDGGRLRAWRLEKEPVEFPVRASQGDDHRLMYLDYEGPVSGERGYVDRWDGGSLVWGEARDDRYVFDLQGEKLAGRFIVEECVGGWRFDKADAP